MKLNVQFASILMVMSLSLCLMDVPAVRSQDPVFDDQEVQGKAMVNHVIKEILTNTDASCRIKCHLIRKCVSYNLGPSTTPGMMVCQLNDADRHQYPQDHKDRPGYSYRGIKKPCVSSLDEKDASSVLTGPSKTQEQCVCFSGYTGKHCEKVDEKEWKKLNHAPVCIGAKDNAFGTVEIPFDCKKKQLKLVHVSGSVRWHEPKTAGNWGDTAIPESLFVFITDSSNQIIFPFPGYPGFINTYFRVSNITVTSPELIYPEPFEFSEGDQIRIWFSYDLYDAFESAGHGATCADLYVRDF